MRFLSISEVLDLHQRVIAAAGGSMGVRDLGALESAISTPGKKLTQRCQLWPSDRSLHRIREKVRKKIGRRYSMSLEEMIAELNPVLRGWNNYHKPVDPCRKRFRSLNEYVWDRLRIFLRRKHNDDTRSCRRLRNGLLPSQGLYRLA
jgi:hypothetical protein